MRKLIVILLAAVLLTGCGLDLSKETEATVPYWAGHTDHVSPKARNQRGFTVQIVQDEGRTVYLAYKEPDGCITNVAQIGHWEEPQLFCEENTFYYVETSGTFGTLYSVAFTGETASLLAQDVQVDYIIRIEDGSIYCSANDGEMYVCVDLSLTQWEEVSKEEAITQ